MMKHIILLLTIIYSFNSFSQQEVKRNAVIPGELEKAYCLPEIKSSLTVDEIITELRPLGHDLRALKDDPRFTNEHFQDIYRGIKLMPNWLKSGQIGRHTSVSYHPNSRDRYTQIAAYSPRHHFVYINPTNWSGFDKGERAAIIFHELAHSLANVLFEIDESSLWENIESGWKAYVRSNGTIHSWLSLDSGSHVSRYSMTNPIEDFAESMSSYRITPKLLKEKSDKKYNFIKDIVFLGQEFTDASQCYYEISDVVDQREIENILESKLSNNHYYTKLAYEYLMATNHKYHPTAIKDLLLNYTVWNYINKIGAFENTSREDFILKSKLRAYYKNYKDFSYIGNKFTDYYVEKLKKNGKVY